MARKQETSAQVGMVRARVLQACAFGNTDDVVDVPTAQVSEATAAGLIDSNPDSVACAESLVQG